MNQDNILGRDRYPILLRIIVAMMVLVLCAMKATAQNPNSDTTSTGQALTINITSPADSAEIIGLPCEVTVEGLVTLSDLPAYNINVLYVLDLSGSTGEGGLVPDSVARIDVNGDGVVDAGDDFNGDGHIGDILDAEIGGVLSLNKSIGDPGGVELGIIGFSSNAMNADISPESGFQLFSPSPQADLNHNGIPDLEEVLRSMDSNQQDLPWGGSIELFTPLREAVFGYKTNFKRALERIIYAFSTQPDEATKIAFFLSNGFKNEGGAIDEEIARAAAAGIVIHTFGISAFSSVEFLKPIAEGTGGTFTHVLNPSEITTILPGVMPVGISGVTVNDMPVDLTAIGTFSTTVSFDKPGLHTIAATATADDGTSVTARIAVICWEGLFCECQITAPEEGAMICRDSVTVEGKHTISGGAPPYKKECSVNGIPAAYSNDMFKATVPLEFGQNCLIATCTVIDSGGNTAVCSDTVCVTRLELPICKVEITSPKEGAVICKDSVTVKGIHSVAGGVAPYTWSCSVNGITAPVSNNTFEATVPLVVGPNCLVATCAVLDSCGNQAVCSDTVCVTRAALPVCKVEITSPKDGAVICKDSVTVKGSHSVTGGIAPYTWSCSVNGITAAVSNNTFEATVPLVVGSNCLIATCTVLDSCGNQAVCSDTVCVTRVGVLICEVQIITPQDSAVVCDSAEVSAELKITNGVPPLVIKREINGITPDVYGDIFMAKVPVTSGYNPIIAKCTVTDSFGNTVVCSDSISVLLDDIPPTCTFYFEEEGVFGTFIDNESGIASIVTLYLSGGTLEVDDFAPGDNEVGFRILKAEPDASIGFDIQVSDMCGNIFIFDPIMQILSADGSTRYQEFYFPNYDRYLQLTNHGLSQVNIDLNGNQFNLFTDPVRVEQEINAYFMPGDGKITIDMQPYLHEQNTMIIEVHGLPGTRADLMISNFSAGVDYILDLQPVLPVSFDLSQNYPNPFNPETNIRFDIPAQMTEGTPVRLLVYNLLGQLVRTLVDEVRFPGQYIVQWDSRNEFGERVPSGIYFYTIVAGKYKAIKKMTLVR